ncbi:MAG TPA: FixH family protein [Thiolinea sp.]|nr:FixH family protein [Thiolinea sp.]
MYLDSRDTQPWYRQFWPWALIFLPLSVVVASMVTLMIAMESSSGLVVDDYYNEGRSINRTLARGQQAATLGLSASMALNGQQVRLVLTPPAEPADAGLTLAFRHATQAGYDQVINLHQRSPGVWDGRIQPLPAGKWYLQLLPADERWRLDGVLPTADSLSTALEPQT